MFKSILVRLAPLVPTFIGVTIVAFAFIRLLPGDPILLMAGERGISAERYAQLQAQFGFDRPLPVQYWEFLKGLLHGDLGNSLVTHSPVVGEFFSRFQIGRAHV